MLLSDSVTTAASGEQIAFEKRPEVMDRRLGFLDCLAQERRLLQGLLNPGMVRQILQKFISPFGGFDRHLGPEARRVRFSAAQVLGSLPEGRRGSFEAA